MRQADSSRWGQIRSRRLAAPEARERYERTRRSMVLTRQVLQLIDAEREKVGLSKADLARRVGVNPSTIRRLLTSGDGNPTLRTVLDILDVLDLELALRPKAPTHKLRRSRKPSSSARATDAAAV